MKVSVVIPAYNEEKYIKKALKSILNQRRAADEILVIDNNSIDKTAEIARKIGVRVIPEKIQGMIPARNRGFNEAKYDIIARIDADVVAPTDWLEKVIKDFETKPIDALSGPVAYYDSRIVPKSPAPSRILYKSLSAITKGKKYLVGPNMSLTKDIWEKVKNKVNLDDKKVHEDIDLTLNIYKIGGVIEFDKDLVVQFSARRIIHNPTSFFIEYPKRMITTFKVNKT